MFARNLEFILLDLCLGSDASIADLTDMDKRFESLRGMGDYHEGENIASSG